MEKWILYAIISMLFAGLTSVIAKFGMKDLSSNTALAIAQLPLNSKKANNVTSIHAF